MIIVYTYHCFQFYAALNEVIEVDLSVFPAVSHDYSGEGSVADAVTRVL